MVSDTLSPSCSPIRSRSALYLSATAAMVGCTGKMVGGGWILTAGGCCTAGDFTAVGVWATLSGGGPSEAGAAD